MIFSYWRQGWDSTPAVVDVCKRVSKHWHGDNLVLLDQNNEKDWVNTREVIPSFPSDIPVQAYSDILRLSLLRTYGGCWADATVLFTKPLDLDINLFVASNRWYRVHSWFLQFEQDSLFLKEWIEETRKYWHKRVQYDTYFWVMVLAAKVLKKYNIKTRRYVYEEYPFFYNGDELRRLTHKRATDEFKRTVNLNATSVAKLNYKIADKRGSIGAYFGSDEFAARVMKNKG